MTGRPQTSEAAEESPAASAPIEPAAHGRAARPSHSPDFDLELGIKLRAARAGAGMTQTQLGCAVGVSFQQIQKYERGADRVAAGTLQKLAAALNTHPGSFFDGMPAPVGGISDLREVMTAAVVIQQIQDPETRRHLIALAEALAKAETGRA